LPGNGGKADKYKDDEAEKKPFPNMLARLHADLSTRFQPLLFGR
jgi:hypothetical protein